VIYGNVCATFLDFKKKVRNQEQKKKNRKIMGSGGKKESKIKFAYQQC
jgi:hypothetical protein